MKRTLRALSQQYVIALKNHLQQGSRASLRPARGLGCHAGAMGLETLDLARIHERALATLEASSSKHRLAARAAFFLTEAITPILKLKETLRRRTRELASTNRRLQRGIVRRKSVEAALKKNGRHNTSLLKDSLQLQEVMRHRTHQMLSAQEEERQTISQQLQDEIVQILLSINVRLLSLRKTANGDTSNMAKEIASTQRLVEESVQLINRFARELDLHEQP